jgi:hypothetical protein
MAAAPNSKPSKLRCQLKPHVLHRSAFLKKPVKNARLPPHHAQRLKRPRKIIVTNPGRGCMRMDFSVCEFINEFSEDASISHRIIFRVHHRDQPLLI